MLPSVYVKTLGIRNKLISKLYQHFRQRDLPYGLQDSLPTLSPSCSLPFANSAMDPRLDTGGWLALTGEPLDSSFPTGTFTRKDALSFAQRDNARLERRRPTPLKEANEPRLHAELEKRRVLACV